MTIEEVYPGEKYAGFCISDLHIWGVENEMPKILDTIYIKDKQDLRITPIIKHNNEYFCNLDSIMVEENIYHPQPMLDDMMIIVIQITSVKKEYDNFTNRNASEITPIQYEVNEMNAITITEKELKSGYGTYFFGANISDSFKISNDSFTTKSIIHKDNSNIVQVVYRKDDSYLGILMELFNTPFVFVPKYYNSYHQTDERIGSDCAEFAIYGMRRLGYEIPYCGPINIHNL